MDYATVKIIHQGAVALSIAGFFTRGLGALSGADWVRSRRPGTRKAPRAIAWLAALAVVGWIVSVAITKRPLGFLA